MFNRTLLSLVCITSISFGAQCQNKSTIVLTSRSYHPKNKEDTLSTLKAIQQFKPSRLDWTYTSDSNITAIYHRLKIPFSLAINPMTADSAGSTTKKLRIQTIDGETFVAPWMKDWKIKTPYWGCVNNPEFQELFYQNTLKLVRLKPYGIMVDNPEFNARLKLDKLAGCFCEHCVDKYVGTGFWSFFTRRRLFRKMNQSISNSKSDANNKSNMHLAYEKFQEESVTEFLQNWKNRLLQVNPNLKFICNNFNGEWASFHQVFDGGMAELNENFINEKSLDNLYKRADDLHKTQLFNSNSSKPEVHELLLKYALSHKRDALIPWDLYLKDSPHRFYINYQRFEKLQQDY